MQVNRVQQSNYNTNFGARIKFNQDVEALVALDTGYDGFDYGNNVEGTQALKSALERLSKVGGDTVLDLHIGQTRVCGKHLLTLENHDNGQKIFLDDGYLSYGSKWNKSTFVKLIDKAIDDPDFLAEPKPSYKIIKNIYDYFA